MGSIMGIIHITMTRKDVQFLFTKGGFWFEEVFDGQEGIYSRVEFAQIASHKVLEVKSEIAQKFINEIEN